MEKWPEGKLTGEKFSPQFPYIPITLSGTYPKILFWFVGTQPKNGKANKNANQTPKQG